MAQAQTEQKKPFNAEMAGVLPMEDRKTSLSLVVPKKIEQTATPEMKNEAHRLINTSSIPPILKKEANRQIDEAKTIDSVKGVLEKYLKDDPLKAFTDYVISYTTKRKMDLDLELKDKLKTAPGKKNEFMPG